MDTIKEVRNAIKKLGYNSRQISVRDGGGCYETCIKVTIKNLDIDIDEIKKVCNTFVSVSYDERSYEILAGGNTFVNVSYDWEVVRDEEKKYIPEAKNIILECSKTPDKGHLIIEKGLYEAIYYPDNKTVNILKRPDDYQEKTSYCLDTIERYTAHNEYAIANALLWINKFFSNINIPDTIF
jgi:hypothetical protein